MRKVNSKDGTPIAFDRTGQGPALILVGGGGSTRSAAEALAATLAPDFTVFAYDRRGKGDSGDTPPYAVEREVEDMDAVIEEAGGPALVFGHSSGAVLALEAARLLPPNRIGKLALYEPPFIVDGSRPPAPKDAIEHLNELVSSGRRGEAVEYFTVAVVGAPAEMVANMRQSPMWPGMEALAHTFAYELAITGDTESGDPRSLQKWASVTIPTLVMDGTLFMGREAGHAFMRNGADALARVLPNAQRRTLEGQDHGAAAPILASALKQFFIA